MKDKQNEKERIQKPRISIKTKFAVQIAVTVGIISVITFAAASHLHKILTIQTSLQRNTLRTNSLVNRATLEALKEIFEEGREIYESIPEEERKDPRDPSYQTRFEIMKNSEYQRIFDGFCSYSEFERIKWIDLRIRDNANQRYVYLMDTDSKEDGRYGPGFWESSEKSPVATFITEEVTNNFVEKLPEFLRPTAYTLENILEIEMEYTNLRQFVLLTPLKDPETGEVMGYLGIGELLRSYNGDMVAFSILFVFIILISLMIVILIARAAINREIILPVMRLSDSARYFVTNADTMMKTGHYFEQVEIHTHDEVRVLRDSMIEMEDNLKSYMDNLTQMTAERERMTAEMDLSSRIQIGMLPTQLLNYSGVRNFDITSRIRSAKEVSGDFYDYFAIDDERVGIVIADVSGKGVPAALFMMVVKILLLISGKELASPVEALKKVNRQLCQNNREMLFVTVWLGIYHVREKTICYANAGHEYPALYKSSEDTFRLIEEEHDFVLGFDPEATFTEMKITLDAGDKLFLYTDGIPEANSEAGDMYGNGRMLNALNRNRDRSGEDFLNAMEKDVEEYTSGAEQSDDMTMLLLEIR